MGGYWPIKGSGQLDLIVVSQCTDQSTSGMDKSAGCVINASLSLGIWCRETYSGNKSWLLTVVWGDSG